MNRIFHYTICISLAVSLLACEKENAIPASELPAAIQDYIALHFIGCSIEKATKEKRGSERYDITLDCGMNLEFNKQAEVIDIDGNSSLPNSVIPVPILDYLLTNYFGDRVVGWELEGNNQLIELNTEVVLEFDANDNFIRIVE